MNWILRFIAFATLGAVLVISLPGSNSAGSGKKASLCAFIPVFSTRLAMATPATSYQTKLEKTQYKGWSVYRLSNGVISLFIAPDLGGRAIPLLRGDHSDQGGPVDAQHQPAADPLGHLAPGPA